MLYSFGNFELDSDRSELRVDGEILKIEPQVYSLLEILLTHHDRVVSKEEINEHVWGGRIVSDGSVDNRISAARNAIGDDGRTQALIKTFPGRGFRFVGEVKIMGDCEATVRPQTTHATQVHIASIAVLPFANMITGEEDKYLGDGLSEEILNVLASIEGLKVASRTSAFTFRDDQANISQISEALGVEHVLEGSVRKSGKTLRITAQLILAAGDQHLWSKTYDRIYGAENILQIQDDIAREISHRLAAELDLPPLALAPRIQSLEAYQHFLQGREFARDQQPDSLEHAIEAFEQAIALESTYVPAYAELIHAYRDQEFYAGVPKEEVLRKMKATLAKGQAVAPEHPDLLVAAGRIEYLQGTHSKALGFYESAISLSPNHARAHAQYADVLYALGRFEAALEATEQALIFDPVSPSLLGNLAYSKMARGDLSGAMVAARKNVKWNPDAEQALNMMSRLLRYQGNYSEAHRYLIDAAKINADEFNVQNDLALLYLDIGLDDPALAVSKKAGTKAATMAYRGQCEGALKITALNINDYEAAFAAYICGDMDLAYRRYRDDVTNYGLHLPDTNVGTDEPDWFATYAYVLRQKDDPDGDMLLGHIERYFGNKAPSEFQLPNEFLGAAAMHMMKGDPDQALVWIDAAIDHGHVFLKLTREPIFAPLASNPAYALRLEKMENKAKQYRAIIEERL